MNCQEEDQDPEARANPTVSQDADCRPHASVILLKSAMVKKWTHTGHITLLRKLRVAQISRLFAMSAILFAHMANRAMCAPPRGIPTQLNKVILASQARVCASDAKSC